MGKRKTTSEFINESHYIHGPLIRIKYTKYKTLYKYLIHKLSRVYKYRIKDNWYRNFLDMCRGEQLPSGTTLKDVKMYQVNLIQLEGATSIE